MPYGKYGNRYRYNRRSSNYRGRGRPYGSARRSPFKGYAAKKYITGYGTRAYRSMGIHGKGVIAQYNQVFRFTASGGGTADPTITIGISGATFQSTGAQMGALSLDLLKLAYDSTSWGTEVNARFNTICVKGFCVTR